MSNRLTFSLASLIVLIALGFIATPAMAAEFANNDNIGDVSVVQGQKIDITFPTATSTEPAGDDPATDPAGVMSATLTPTGGSPISPSAADPPVAETAGTLRGLTFTFDATTGVGKLTGNASPIEVTRILLTYTITETDGGDDGTDPADPASLVFAFEVRPQTDMLTFGNASISDKELTIGNYFYEVLPGARDGIGPLTYSIVGTLPAGLTFVPATRVLSGTPSAAVPRAVLTYTVTDSTDTTPDTETISFTIEVKARVNGPMFAADMTKVPDAAYTEGHAIEAMTLPAADITNALGSVTYALTGLPTGTGLSFDAATRMLTGTPSDKDQAASPIAAMYTAEDQDGNDAELPFKITVNDMVSVTAPSNVTDHELGNPFMDITIPAVSGGTGDSTVEVTGLPAGLMRDGMKITGDPTAIGSTTVTITATDTLGAMGTKDFMITVKKADAITFASVVAPQTYTVGTPITPMLLPVGSGGIGTLSYALDNLPGGITFDPTTRLLRGTPTAEMATADYNYVITDSAFGHIPAASRTADHKANSIILPISITVKAAPTVTNSAPDFGTQTIPNIDATAGTAISGMFLPEATDADGDTLVYSISPAPPRGLLFNRTARTLTGTPGAAMAQTAYTYKVEDGNGGMDTIGFFITVSAASNVAPVYADTTPIAIMGTAGMAITPVSAAATDANGDALTYSWDVDETALGLMLNTSTGMISGTPKKAHTGSHPVTATDSGGLTAMRGVNVTIAPAPAANVAPVVTITTAAPTEPQMNSFVIAYTATDANAGDTPGVAVTHTISPDTATGYTVDSSTDGMVTITQAAGSPIAVVKVTITATDPRDSSLSDSASISVTFAAKGTAPVVTAPGPLMITATAGDTEVTLNWTTPTGSAVDSYEYSMNGGETWVSIANSGATTVMHTVTGLTNGQLYSFIVRARNRAGFSISNEISATPVIGPPAAPAGLTAVATADTPGSVTLTWTAVTGAMYQYSKDGGTTWMDATSPQAVTGLTGGTAVTFSVRVKAAGNVPAGMAATATATPTAPPSTDGTFKIPAESHIIVVHDEGSDGLPTSVMSMEWKAMPDLENLLYTGGTIAVTMADANFDHDGKADTDMRKPAARDAVITEVMWARNLALVGKAGELSHQWIEIYNNLKVDVTVSIGTKQGQPALGAGSGQILVDRLSNVVGARWQLTGLGQNGSDDGKETTANTDFISMYRKERGKDGHVKGHWAQSTETYLANHKGTPGAKERKQVAPVTPTAFDVGPVIFNEVSNRSSGTYEWFELRNKSGVEQNLKNRRISIVTAVNSDVWLFDVGDADLKILAGDVLLFVASDPSGDPDHPLAAGWNVSKNAANQVNGVGAHSPRYIILEDNDKRKYNEDALDDSEGLPNNGEFVLILRTRTHGDDVGKDTNIWDIAGYSTKLKISSGEAGFTNLWPLKGGVRSAELGNNKLEKDQVHRRQKDNVWGTSSTNYGRNDGNHHDDTAWRNHGWTGVGYKRNAAANNAHGGTPGYPNDAIKSEGIAQSGQVIISEIMFDASRNLPQWIELQNLSTSVGVNIDNWSIFVVNHNLNVDGSPYDDGKLSERIDLDGRIPPGQTFLIVSTGNRHDTQLPPERIHNLRRGRGATLLSPKGFRIQLKAKTNEGDAAKHQLVDEVGNLPDKPANNRRADAQSFMDPAWMLPSGTTEDGDRVSIARKTTKDTDDQNHRTELLDLQATGVSKWGWIRSDEDTRLSRIHHSTYYGHATDIASPGQTVGSILPVSLSKFRPERLDNGSIRIVWVTESETNNAGFNILRSEKRDGEFTKLNTKLIAGKGTTSEKNAYEFVDTSAKPNVVYYYQIQDVSFDGDVATLRTTHVRGNVTPAGKATTTWGELKALQ